MAAMVIAASATAAAFGCGGERYFFRHVSFTTATGAGRAAMKRSFFRQHIQQSPLHLLHLEQDRRVFSAVVSSRHVPSAKLRIHFEQASLRGAQVLTRTYGAAAAGAAAR